MIQRIQSIYLLISGLLMGSLFFLPLAKIIDKENAIYTFLYRGIENSETEIVIPTLALAILLTAATAVAFISIFLFKKRMLQIRLCGLNMGLLLGSTGMVFYLGSQAVKEIAGDISYELTTAFPIVALILTFMALRAIGKDVALLKSMDRIR